MGNCRNRLRQESPDITTKEINKARLLWVKQIKTLLVTDSKLEKTKTNLGIFGDEEMKKGFTDVVGDYTKQVYHLSPNTLS